MCIFPSLKSLANFDTIKTLFPHYLTSVGKYQDYLRSYSDGSCFDKYYKVLDKYCKII